MLLLNDKPICHFIFSGGEIQVKLPQNINKDVTSTLLWKPIDASEIILLGLAVNALKQMGICEIYLDILYLPYARQDRVCSKGEAYSLEFICKFLDNLHLTHIRIWHVHNEKKTKKLFENTHVSFISAMNIFSSHKVLDKLNYNDLIVCHPDNGSFCSAFEIFNEFRLVNLLGMRKERCSETGKIVSMIINENYCINGNDVLIIDDICDGGTTFNKAAKILKENGANNLYLYVTHGIFSNGLEELQDNYKHIICHHVLHDEKFKSTDKLTILKEYNSAS